MKNARKWLYLVIGFLSAIVVMNILARCCNRRAQVVEYKVDTRWSKLMLVLDQIEKNYVDTVDYKSLTEKTLPTLLEQLDPHSVYLPPQDLEEADESLQGNFSGIGIEFNVPNDTAIVINVIHGGPSEKVGLQSGDRIVKVDTQIVAGVKMPQDSLIKKLRGPVGSKVKVGIKRASIKELLPFTIKRDIIPVKSVDAAIMLTDKLGYIKISKFSKTTYTEFIKGVTSLMFKGMESLLLDLRDNPGGYMDQAFLMANEFLEKEALIVYMQGRMRHREDYKADGSGLCKDIKLYVAIDESSASSSEIVAGAIQDNDRGTIIGRRSFGKGLVQEPVYFSDKSGIRLTVARFYTPSGRCIQKPYSKAYMYDIIERYQHGELQNADSIKVNDSLTYTTLSGRKVYGGGGIVPDVFVPLDTVGVSDFLIEANRKSVQMKFTSEFADKNRAALVKIKSLEELEAFYAKVNLSEQFRSFAAANGVVAKEGDWAKSKTLITMQLKGLIGRYASLDDDAFYPFILKVDNLAEKVLELEGSESK